MRLVQYKRGTLHDQATRVAVVDDRGHKWLKVVFFDSVQLRVLKVGKDEARFMRDITSRPRIKLTPLASTAKRWLKHDSTKGARSILQEAANG